MEALGKPDLWAQHGLVGLVIFALFGLVIFLIIELKTGRSDFISALKETANAIKEMALSIERNTGNCGLKK